MTYVQQNKRNLVIAAAAALPPLPATPSPAPAAPPPRLRLRSLRPRPRRTTARTLVLAAVAALVPVSVGATVVVHHVITSHDTSRAVGSGVDGSPIRVPVVAALPEADASTWSVLTRPPGAAERDADTVRLLRNSQDNSRFGLNAGLARLVTTRDGVSVWLMPGNGFVCLGLRATGDSGMSVGCNTAEDARAGALTASDGAHVFGIVPDGVRSVTVTDADTGLRHDEPVADNVYELAYQPASVEVAAPGSAPVTFDVLR